MGSPHMISRIFPHTPAITIACPAGIRAPQGERGPAVSFVIIFTLAYFLGGFSALLILGLTVAARRGDSTDRYQAAATKRRG